MKPSAVLIAVSLQLAALPSLSQGKGPFLVGSFFEDAHGNSILGWGAHPTSAEVATNLACIEHRLGWDASRKACQFYGPPPHYQPYAARTESMVCDNGGYYAHAFARRGEHTGNGFACGHRTREAAVSKALTTCRTNIERKAPGAQYSRPDGDPLYDCALSVSAQNDGTYSGRILGPAIAWSADLPQQGLCRYNIGKPQTQVTGPALAFAPC